jgi:serine/threonine-protein kinase
MTLVSLAEGSLFAGRYQIARCIAQGGMAAVYEAVHVKTQRRRALKVMLPDILRGEDLQDRFRQAACITANIASNYIVDVVDADIDGETQMPFLVMELLRGEELDKRLKREGKLDPKEAVTYLHHVALGLERAHRAAIVHRDLKPGHVFLAEQEDGSTLAKILDFGVARLIAEGATSAGASQNLGTPLYMAPEQFNIGQKVSPAADIFSLGMMAYVLLVGAPYWQEEVSAGANVFAFAARAMHGPPEPATVRAKRQGVRLPAWFDEWFAKATAVEPEARFPTASSASAALAKGYRVTLSPERERVSIPSLNPALRGALEAGDPARPAAVKGSRQKQYAVVIAAVALGLALAAGGVHLLRREADPSAAQGLDEMKRAAETPAPDPTQPRPTLASPEPGASKAEPNPRPMPSALSAAAEPTAPPAPSSQPSGGGSTAALPSAAAPSSPTSDLDSKPPPSGTATSPVKTIKKPEIERD